MDFFFVFIVFAILGVLGTILFWGAIAAGLDVSSWNTSNW